jgi:hypothetical protein
MIPAKVWQACTSAKVAPAGALSFSVDVALDRSSASIAVADKEGNIELIENREGVSWVQNRALELHRRWKGSIVVDGYGPSGSLVDPLKQIGVPVITYKTSDVTAACALFYDAVLDRQVRAKSDDRLDRAVNAAMRRNVGQTWLFQRNIPEADITPLYASVFAWHQATHRAPPARPRAMIY